jgi:lipopolysaccharide export system protein LptA
MKGFQKYLFLFLFLFFSFTFVSVAQEKVELLHADILQKVPNQPNVRKLIKNVSVKHKGTTIYCDSAYLYEDKNSVDTYGKTSAITENGATLTAKNTYYDGNSQTAKARGDVVLMDDKMRLETNDLDYQIQTGIAYYTQGGKLADNEKTLTSKEGTYDTNSKIFYFSKDVVLLGKKDNQTINTENLTYHTITKMAYFKGKTKITSKDGVVNTNMGNYNTETQVSEFQGRSRVEDKDFTLEADSLMYDNSLGFGYGLGNVEIFSKEDSLFAEGDFGWIRRKDNEAKIYGDVISYMISQKDTLWLKADTVYAINEKAMNGKKMLLAYHNTKVFRKDFQAKCDSLSYNRLDSTMRMFGDPVVWGKKSQITADSINLFLENNQPQKAEFNHEAFMLSEDTLKNYNQLKGKRMTAFFKKREIRKVEVRGNAQNIFFLLKEKENKLIGMNRVDCSDMNVYFNAKNQIQKVAYINKPEGSITPKHELQEPQKKIKNFKWRIDEMPKRDDFIRNYKRIKN